MESGLMMGLDGFGVLDRAAKKCGSSREAGGFGRGKKLQSFKSFQKKVMTMDHHDNHHRPFSGPPYEFGPCDGDGPTTCTSSSRPKSSIIYDVVVATTESGAVSASGGAAAFDISSTINSEVSHTPAFKYPEGMAASLKFLFTTAQWKELERQALIYKYIMASLPVPPDLLFPNTRNPSVPAASYCPSDSGLNLRFSGRGDFEPGRCRRTDGKKWRCSRNAAPDQKYCERHMHRGLPRSRKHVELPKKKTRHGNTQDLPLPPSTSVLPKSSNDSPSPFLGNVSQPFHQNHTTEFPYEVAKFGSLGSVTSFKELRGSDWMMGKESVSVASLDQDWQHLIHLTKIELPSSSPVLNQNYCQEPLSFNSYHVDFGKDQDINNCPLFPNPDIILLDKPQENPGRSFIDAWSSDGCNVNPGSKADERVSLSTLSLSMGGSSIVVNEMSQINMGLGVIEPDQNQECGAKSLLSNWLAPASWTALTPGGPLAEVLRPTKVARATTTTEASCNPLPPGSKKVDP